MTTTTKTKMTVTTKFGTFARTTARAYTHMVITTGPSVAQQVARIKKNLDYALQEKAKYDAVLTRNDPAEIAHGFCEWTRATWEGFRAATERQIASYTAELNSLANAPEPTEYKAHSWSSRLALALKEAAKAREFNANVRVIEIATGNEV